jgi:hypothetical protein
MKNFCDMKMHGATIKKRLPYSLETVSEKMQKRKREEGREKNMERKAKKGRI